MDDFNGRVALVTGGARGIGQATARALHAAGARVAVADLNGDEAQAEATHLDAAGKTALPLTVDVSDPAQVTAMVQAVTARFGRLDILVHSAGVGLQKDFLDTSLADWNRVLTTNLTGTFLTGQACARVMAKAGYGRIVFLASTAGERGGTGRAAYGSSKGGIIALTRVMAVELAEAGVTVNALAPGGIETELVKKMHTAGTRKAYVRSMAIRRYGMPAEVAHSALYLASEGARYVTGEILHVDGGFTAAGVMIRDED